MKVRDSVEINMETANVASTVSGSGSRKAATSSAPHNPSSRIPTDAANAAHGASYYSSAVGDIQHISRRQRGGSRKGLHSADETAASPSQFGIQFTLGDGDEMVEETPQNGTSSHPLFCEMEELRPAKDGSLEWKETARWIKFEEDVEEGGNRWSKPFVATGSLHHLLELRSFICQSAMLLEADVVALPVLCDLIINEWIHKGMLQDYHRDQVRDVLLRRHRHQFEGCGDYRTSYAMRQLSGLKRSISQGIFSMTHMSDAAAGVPPATAGPLGRPGDFSEKFPNNLRRDNVPNVMSAASMISTDGSDGVLIRNASRGNLHFTRKLPPNTESFTILVGEVEFVPRPICGFVRIHNDICVGNLSEVNVPTRFVFLLLGPLGYAARFHEIGRAMGALCSDEVFQQCLYRAKNKKEIIDGLDEFLGEVTVLPPGEWDPQIRIEPPKKLPSQPNRKRSAEGSLAVSSPVEEKKEEVQVTRTGRFFGGLVEDIKRKSRFYASDFRDGIALQSIAATIFLYFATLTPVVAFGAVLGMRTGNDMAAMESLLSAAIVGILWAFFSGQPLIIMGSTGPVLIFETIVTKTCASYDLDYLAVRFWIGMWTGLFLLIMVATDASYLVRYITRFTEEGFAALISFIFIVESFENLIAVRKTRNVCTYPLACPAVYEECWCNMTQGLSKIGEDGLDRRNCKVNNGTLTGSGCSYVPDVLFLSVILFFGTFVLANKLKAFRSEPYFPTKVRQIVSDFSVTLAIILMSLVDFILGLDTPKLIVPSGLTPTNQERSWLVHPFGRNPYWTSVAAIIPAIFAVILIFMDQQITAVIVNRPENKLKKGCGYHLDLLVLTVSVVFCAVMGLPWMVAATVLSINHVSSLKQESDVKVPGEATQFESVRENRLTTLCIYLFIGASVFMTPLLSRIPMPVLYGVFLFMGVSALGGLQFVDRLVLLLMPMKYQPDYAYLRHVPIKRIHLFTFIQTVCLALLWVLKSFDESAILFPLMVLALVGVRKLMDFVFRQKELVLLDDIMPEITRRKKEDAQKVLEEVEHKPGLTESESTGHVSVPLPNGHIMKIPVSIPEEANERSRPTSPASPETPGGKREEKSPSQSKRWSRSDKKKDPHVEQALLGTSKKSIFSRAAKHVQISEENEEASQHPAFPVITICPATPRGSRSSNLDKEA
ncbi:sodium bicarbonate cotransporter 3-like [Paramacrobiotus metropolitanus]|uniref:sodium bicarbonate cotransporter 3-like n=1 Tax=Paramacrobiotus metropolitanus TaxID=2943436 RepID=UPI0024464DB4|nr:sodium bicarbonate cotransporter 3-like [Paramacrobiotus metropolitanus]